MGGVGFLERSTPLLSDAAVALHSLQSLQPAPDEVLKLEILRAEGQPLLLRDGAQLCLVSRAWGTENPDRATEHGTQRGRVHQVSLHFRRLSANGESACFHLPQKY